MGTDPVNEDEETSIDMSWVAIPLTALLIPILAISLNSDGGGPVVWSIAALLPIIACIVAARSILNLRHKHRLEELRLQAEISANEAVQLAEANRVIERNRIERDPTITSLRDAVRAQEATAASARPETER